MVLSAKLRNRRLATPCTNYGTVGENMESGVLFVAYKKRPLLELKLETDSYYFYIEIKDNGIGFTKEDLAHATELFYQGDKSRKSQKNHGIGLYSVKKIMEFHHGEILLKNRENGQGAIVVMKLPLSNK